MTSPLVGKEEALATRPHLSGMNGGEPSGSYWPMQAMMPPPFWWAGPHPPGWAFPPPGAHAPPCDGYTSGSSGESVSDVSTAANSMRLPVGWVHSGSSGESVSDVSTAANSKRKGKSRKRARSYTDDEGEDVIDLLPDEAEALQIVEFDPSVQPKDSWQPPKSMEAFLTKYFNRSLSDDERPF